MGAPAEAAEHRILKTALILYAAVFALKLAAYFITGVMALLAEAFHTLSDMIISGFLFVAAIYSRRAPDQGHMFGHGRAQHVAALVAATLFVSFTALRLYEEAIPRLFRPSEADYQHLGLAVAVIAVSMGFAVVPMIRLMRQTRRGPAARALLVELVNDELGLLAALVGILLIALGYPMADPMAAIAVATIIAYNGVRLLRENVDMLLGRSPGPEFLAEVERLARSVDGVLGVHDLRAESVGPDAVHVGMHIEVRPDLPVREATRIAHEVEARVHAHLPAGYCVIHVDPGRFGDDA